MERDDRGQPRPGRTEAATAVNIAATLTRLRPAELVTGDLACKAVEI